MIKINAVCNHYFHFRKANTKCNNVAFNRISYWIILHNLRWSHIKLNMSRLVYVLFTNVLHISSSYIQLFACYLRNYLIKKIVGLLHLIIMMKSCRLRRSKVIKNGNQPCILFASYIHRVHWIFIPL